MVSEILTDKQTKNITTLYKRLKNNLRRIKNKDDNIHKSEALKRYDRRTLTLVECQN